jgi:fructose-1,6-bisphosphatase/inositol monophosphatase family enzyme
MDLWGFAGHMRLALYQAGQAAVALQGQVSAEHKAPDSPHQQSTAVSLADRLSQELILLRAYDLAPDLEVQSEELAACPEEIAALFRGNRHRYALILDPIDGTDDYLSGRPTYGIMLGLLDQEMGRMACGLIHLPAVGPMYVAIREVGAFVGEGLWGALRPLSPAKPPRNVADTKRLTEADHAWFARHGVPVVPGVSRSSAYELLRVATGQVGALAMRHFHGYDSAVASVLIEALGGAALGPDGRPVCYEKAMPRLPLVVLALDREFAEEIAEGLGAEEAPS